MYPTLTDIACKNAKPREKQYQLPDIGGLFLLIMPKGGRYWRLRYSFGGRQTCMALGVYPDVTLAKARERRDEAKRLLTDGIDPAVAKKEKKTQAEREAANTFEVVAREWHDRNLERWTKHYAADILHRLGMDIFPALGKRPVTEIKPLDVLNVLTKIAKRGAPEMAHRAGMYCNHIFRYAVITGRIEHNPASDLRDALQPVRHTHYAALEPKDLPDFLFTLERNDVRLYRQTRLALRMMLLTFVRTSELINATWDEFDIKGAQWTIPAERMKMGRPHIVPLSRQVIEILELLRVSNGNRQWVFASESKPRQPMSNGTILMALKRMGYKGRMTGHGFRALAMTTLQEKLKYPHDVVDRQLAHAPSNKVSAAYDRAKYLDQRRTMMQAWADYIDRLMDDNQNKVVVEKFGANAEPRGDE